MATYFIRQGGHGAQGPFDEARIAGYIAQGKVRPGMEISPDGQRWMPVEEHRLFASAAPAASPVVPPPLPIAPAVVGAVEEIAVAPTRPDRRAARRPRPAPATGGGGKAVAAVIGVLVVGGIAVMASKGGASDPTLIPTPPSRSVQSTAPRIERPPPVVRETREAFRARWEQFAQTQSGVRGEVWIVEEAQGKAKIESICGRKPDRTQTIGGRNYWYFECADGLVQFIWWQVPYSFHYYRINDY